MTVSIAEQLLTAEKLRCEALRAGDMETLSGLLSERLTFMHANAVCDDKQTILTKMGSGNIVYKSLEVDEVEITDLGTAAILRSRLIADVIVGGVNKRLVNRTMAVWTDEDGTWRMLAYQPTPVPT